MRRQLRVDVLNGGAGDLGRLRVENDGDGRLFDLDVRDGGVGLCGRSGDLGTCGGGGGGGGGYGLLGVAGGAGAAGAAGRGIVVAIVAVRRLRCVCAKGGLGLGRCDCSCRLEGCESLEGRSGRAAQRPAGGLESLGAHFGWSCSCYLAQVF